MAQSVTNEPVMENVFPGCRLLLDKRDWVLVQPLLRQIASYEGMMHELAGRVEGLGLPSFIPDLIRLEWTVQTVRQWDGDIPQAVDGFILNPSMKRVELDWDFSQLWYACSMPSYSALPQPTCHPNQTLVWRDFESGQTRVGYATASDQQAINALTDGPLALKSRTPDSDLYYALLDSAEVGLVLTPPSRLRREPARLAGCTEVPEDLRTVTTFTLQWHITHACDLHCKHCYDRSRREAWRLDRALTVLDQMERFCMDRFVRGHISFTGGNPFLHPDFFTLYEAAAQKGFSISLLANPTSRRNLERVLAIQEPSYIQVSLEGLEAHNNTMRRDGHFTRTLDFLELLKELRVESCVMLTLTRDNCDMILPLAELLRDKTDTFTFNRLCPVGEGASLKLPSPKELHQLLKAYIEAAEDNPIVGFKDNMINPILHQQGREPFDGCTGYGCGAAFNFLAVLPDGEVHACRKFPSQVGNLNEQTLMTIYDSPSAQKYRTGSTACNSCPLHYACGGCMAVVHGLGLDVFKDRDPYCYLSDRLDVGIVYKVKAMSTGCHS